MLLDEYTQKAMAVYAFPCPPLPLLVLRGEEGATDLASSHDLLLTGMSVAQHKSAVALERQMRRQGELLAWYNAELDRLHAAQANVEVVYVAMQRYTRETVALYLEKAPAEVDARFAPLALVCRGDLVHQRAAEHLALHRSIAGGAEYPLAGALAMPYAGILRAFFEAHCRDGA